MFGLGARGQGVSGQAAFRRDRAALPAGAEQEKGTHPGYAGVALRDSLAMAAADPTPRPASGALLFEGADAASSGARFLSRETRQ